MSDLDEMAIRAVAESAPVAAGEPNWGAAYRLKEMDGSKLPLRDYINAVKRAMGQSRHPAPLSAIRMPAGTHLAYHVPHEAQYWSANRDLHRDRRQVGVMASAQGQGGGCAWEFYVVEYIVGGKPALRLKMFDDSWSALVEVAPFFAALGGGSVKTLDDVVGLLQELGAVDETERA